jgi:hypothetical protein
MYIFPVAAAQLQRGMPPWKSLYVTWLLSSPLLGRSLLGLKKTDVLSSLLERPY